MRHLSAHPRGRSFACVCVCEGWPRRSLGDRARLSRDARRGGRTPMSPRTRRGLGVWASFLLAAALVPASVLAAPSGRAISQESPAASGAPETPAGSPVTGGTLVFGE